MLLNCIISFISVVALSFGLHLLFNLKSALTPLVSLALLINIVSLAGMFDLLKPGVFMAYGFAGNFGSSGAAGMCQILKIGDNQLYIDYVMYDTVSVYDSYEFEYGEYIYSYINVHKETEKLDALDKIKACGKFYILEGTDIKGILQTRVCCYFDGTFYLLTVSSIDEKTGIPIINRINYSIFDWEE